MNMAKRVYLTINLTAIWIAALLVCDAVGIGKLSFCYGAAVIYRFWHDEVHYPNIHALRYTRMDSGGVDLTVELLDRHGNSIRRVRHEYLEREA